MYHGELPSIQDYFNGKSVLVTGGTGFLGKVIVEKLLRSCPDVKVVYVVVRDGKEKKAEERMRDILNGELFDLVRKQNPSFGEKVIVLRGDCRKPRFSLSSDDYIQVIRTVQVLIHSAASVNFNDRIDHSLDINVRAVEETVKLAKEIKNLEAFVHVSTAYSHCEKTHIEEKIYSPFIDPWILMELISKLSEPALNSLSAQLLNKKPNTYTFTKCLGEYVVHQLCGDIPTAIIRPSIVTGIAGQPFPGWTDNLNGPGGLYVAIGHNLLRMMPGDLTALSDLVPVDYVANSILVACCKLGTTPRHMLNIPKTQSTTTSTTTTSNGVVNEKNPFLYLRSYFQKDKNLKHLLPKLDLMLNVPPTSTLNQKPNLIVFNCVSGSTNPLLWRKHIYHVVTQLSRNHSSSSFFSRKPYYSLSNRHAFRYFYQPLYHTLPAILFDFTRRLRFKKPIMNRLYKRLNNSIHAYGYFTSYGWDWDSHHSLQLLSEMKKEDLETFNFDFTKIDWETYISLYTQHCFNLIPVREKKQIESKPNSTTTTTQTLKIEQTSPSQAFISSKTTVFISTIAIVSTLTILSFSSSSPLEFRPPLFRN